VDNFTITLDYLASVVAIGGQELGEKLAAFYGGQVELTRPKNGYTFGYKVMVGDDSLCEFHLREKEDPWVFTAGPRAYDLHQFLLGVYTSHECKVTRMDAALDVFDAEWFPVLVQVARLWALANGMTTGTAGDWLKPDRGRTFTLGARSSRCFYRIYEKGRKERTDPNWIRCELEYKPQQREDGLSAMALSAPQLWAMHAGPIFGKPMGLDLAELFCMPTTRPSRVRRDVDRARASLCLQYGKTISGWLREVGGDPVALMAELMAGIEHQAAVRKWRDAPPLSLPEHLP